MAKKGIKIKITSPEGEEYIFETIAEAVKWIEPTLQINNAYTQIYSCIRPLRKTIHNYKVEEYFEEDLGE